MTKAEGDGSGSGSGDPSRRRYWVRRALVVVPLVVVAYLGVTFLQVWKATGWDATHHADSIVVLGAAQYNGRPSPALQGRLDHAFVIWKRGMAGTIVLTGSKKPGDRFTEAYSGFRYLRLKGVPEAKLVVVATGTNTWESLEASVRVLRARDLDRVILVSDPYHSFRLVAIAEEVGLKDPQVSSTGAGATLGRLVKETGVVAVGRVIGYRRVTRLFG
jgi:uncharacterized SAM-binding protein YcdF (DUF218 family)